MRPARHVDLRRGVEVVVSCVGHHLQQPGNFPADVLIDVRKRLLLLSSVSQVNLDGRCSKAKACLGIGIAARTPDCRYSPQFGVLHFHPVQIQIVRNRIHTQIEAQITNKACFFMARARRSSA